MVLKYLKGRKYEIKKTERRHEIKKAINENPLLRIVVCELFNVSIQTIRLDAQLNIPELRKRIKSVAKQNYEYIKDWKLMK